MLAPERRLLPKAKIKRGSQRVKRSTVACFLIETLLTFKLLHAFLFTSFTTVWQSRRRPRNVSRSTSEF